MTTSTASSNIVFDDNVKGTFVIQIVIGVGSIHEQKGNRGMSHLLEHMMFKSKSDMSSDKLLMSLNALGGSFNAATNKDWTMYFIKGIDEKWQDCVDIIRRIVFDPHFVTKELITERRVVIEEMLKDLDNNEDVVYELAYKTLLKKDNVYRHGVIGKVRDLMVATPSSLKDYYDHHYTHNNMLVYVNCAKSRQSEVAKYIAQSFPQNFEQSFQRPRVLDWTGVRDGINVNIVKQPNVSQNMSCILFESFKVSDSKNVILDFIWEVLAGNLNSLLMKDLREKKGYIYGISSFVDSYDNGGVTGLSFSSSNTRLHDIVYSIFCILKKVSMYGLSHGVFEYSRASYINRLKFRMTNPDTRHERTMWNLFYGIHMTEAAVLKQLARMTNEDIIDVCKTVFDTNRMAIVSFGKYSDPATTKKQVVDVLASLA